MATIALRVDQLARPAAKGELEEPTACPRPLMPWRAIDEDVERKVEARVSKKLRFRDHLFTFLVDYNRH